MALHVPKAPGFAQMLKEGAKVRPPLDGCADKWMDGCGRSLRVAVRGKPRKAGRAGRHHVSRGAGARGVLALPRSRPGASPPPLRRGDRCLPGPAGRCPAHAAFQKSLRGRGPALRLSPGPGPAASSRRPRDAPGPGSCLLCSESSQGSLDSNIQPGPVVEDVQKYPGLSA